MVPCAPDWTIGCVREPEPFWGFQFFSKDFCQVSIFFRFFWKESLKFWKYFKRFLPGFDFFFDFFEKFWPSSGPDLGLVWSGSGPALVWLCSGSGLALVWLPGSVLGSVVGSVVGPGCLLWRCLGGVRRILAHLFYWPNSAPQAQPNSALFNYYFWPHL